jgi:hypothetical protein
VKTLIGLRWLQQCRAGRRPWLWQAADAHDPSHL